MIVLVTGVPGVGKTTLCTNLEALRADRYVHIPFGELIRSVLPHSLLEEDLRREPSRWVTQPVLAAATRLLLASVAQRTTKIFLVDSHAVAQDSFGYVATPDGPTYFEQVRYDAIVHLHAPAEVILRRSEPATSGRQARTAADLDRHDVLQSSISLAYAGLSACPAYFVDAGASAQEVTRRVNDLLAALGP